VGTLFSQMPLYMLVTSMIPRKHLRNSFAIYTRKSSDAARKKKNAAKWSWVTQ
jgi:hypothetical protein